MRVVPFNVAEPLGQPSRWSAIPLERLFLEVGGFPVKRITTSDTAISKRHHCAKSTIARGNSPASGTRQHVTTSHVVPAHKVGLDNVLPEQHLHRIVDMSGRNVSVWVHALQSVNESRLDWVAYDAFQ
jgi:hypothetical protein